ncbi:MAG: twin transmembrane helix small protein [Gammaproteobacteria bacterium]|nr:twin transmembrane helix small protein [Gammaproteobacteria bacterium]
MFKLLVLVLLAAILVSLFSGLFFLSRGKGNSRYLLPALTVRITLSVLLFLLLLIGWLSGAIQPHYPTSR